MKNYIHEHEDTMIVIAAIIFTLGLICSLMGFSIHPVKNISQIEETTAISTEEATKEATTEETTKNTTISSFSINSSIKQTSKNNFLSDSSQPPITKASSSIFGNSSFSSISAITFYYNDGEPVFISAEEYYTICSIVMGEAGMTYEGSVAVAQSIRNQIIREKKLGHSYDIASIRSTYQLYYDKKPNDTARRAVTDVFHNHIVVTKEPIIAWVSDGYYSSWHASQIKVGSWGRNTFYKLKNQDF